MYSIEVSCPLNVSGSSETIFDELIHSQQVEHMDEQIAQIASLRHANVTNSDFDIDVETDGCIRVISRRCNLYVDRSNIMAMLFDLALHFTIEYVQERRSKRRVFSSSGQCDCVGDFERHMCGFLCAMKEFKPQSKNSA